MGVNWTVIIKLDATQTKRVHHLEEHFTCMEGEAAMGTRKGTNLAQHQKFISENVGGGEECLGRTRVEWAVDEMGRRFISITALTGTREENRATALR